MQIKGNKGRIVTSIFVFLFKKWFSLQMFIKCFLFTRHYLDACHAQWNKTEKIPDLTELTF